VVDLRTGLGSIQRVMATVIGLDATTTDALATALSAGGYAMKVRLLKAYPELDIRLRVGRDAPHSG
jgi:thiamine biosynthesis lipoprotein ApbE